MNTVTGEVVQPVVSSFGDTIKTGIPVPAIGKIVHPSSFIFPKKIPVGKPKVVDVNRNEIKIPESVTIIPVDKNSLKTFTPGMDTSSFIMVNSIGDTLSTGIPIPVTGRITPCIQPQPVKALYPHMTDDASINIKYLDIGEGMNSSYVLSILEQSNGNLWFGTAGGGVSRYNGETFTHFTIKEGFGDGIVYSILEDSYGNLWFCTYRGGVCMYDGEVFTHFTENEGLTSNFIWSIIEDSGGNIWIGTWGGGVSKIDGNILTVGQRSITHLTQKEGLSNNYVMSIIQDSRGNLWFGTWGGGVNKYDGEVFTYITENDGLSNNYVLSILEDSDGNLWFGTEGGGVNMYNGETLAAERVSFIHFTEKAGLSNNIVRSILEDNIGNIWFGTGGGGVNRYIRKSVHAGKSGFKHYTEKEGLSNNIVWSVMQDFYGNLWMGTYGGGVSKYNDDSFIHYTDKEGLNEKLVAAIMEDSDGNLWFGTWNGGVSRYNGEVFTHFTTKEGLTNNRVRSILEDSRGNFWFGTGGGGVCIYDGEYFTHLTEKEGLINNNVKSIVEDGDGNFWFGTPVGACMFNGETFVYYTENEGLCNNDIRTILHDSKGNLWFGTWGGGVSMFTGNTLSGELATFTHFTEKEGLSDNWISSIMEDSHGNLWFGTLSKGVSLFNRETFTHFGEKEGLCNNMVWSILEDSNNNIWVGTENGLNCIMFDQNLSSNRFQSLPASGGTDDGDIFEYKNPVIHTYNLQDGLKGTDFYPNSVILDSKNRIWWGSGKSLTMLNMNTFKLTDDPPTMQLDRVEINGQFTDYRNMKDNSKMKMNFDSVARFFNYPINLELSYKSNHLTFYFSAIDWSAQHKIMYSFKMDGLTNNWSLPTKEPKADYRKLPYGRYIFKVRAIGEAQKWSEPFEYSFTIMPPWWYTWWAKTGYGITAILIIIGIVRLRTTNLKQRQKELEAEVGNATQIIRKQKEEVEKQRDEIEDQKEEIEAQRDKVVSTNEALENQKKELEFIVENLRMTQSQLIQSEKMASVGVLTAGIAHELNNPINFVSSNVKPLLRDVNDVFSVIRKYDEIIRLNKLEDVFDEVDELKTKMDFSFLIKEIINLLEGIEEGANRTSHIVKGLRSFSRLDEEKCQLYNIHEGIDSTLVLLHNKIKDRIKVTKEYGDLKEIECFPGKLNQVIMNILTNSIQAIEDKGEILIQTVSSGIGIKIIIKDNGKGMTPEVKKHIFDPFYTTKDVGKGTGLGLSISYGIIEQHNGNIDVISNPGQGTEFIVSLPISQNENR